jgi:iron(III) transport system substrate-binding protein
MGSKSSPHAGVELAFPACFSRRKFLMGAAVGGLIPGGCRARPPRSLIVYCAHDSLYADSILERFSKIANCTVYAKYDTEASKSLGFVSRLLAEKNSPQCDVFWNNEVLGTAALDIAGVLADLREPHRIERRATNRWVSFGGRLRCVISASRRSLSEESVNSVFEQGELSFLAVAKPMFGTTLTQYCRWAEVWGLSALIERHRDWVRKGLRVVDGNAQVKDLVAAGGCELGFTDSDDLHAARDAGSTLWAEPVRIGGRTICIPNTAAVIAGTEHGDLAHALVAHLCSPEVELELARSPSRQVPLGTVDPRVLPEEVRLLWNWAQDSIDVASLTGVRDEVLKWLRREYSS